MSYVCFDITKLLKFSMHTFPSCLNFFPSFWRPFILFTGFSQPYSSTLRWVVYNCKETSLTNLTLDFLLCKSYLFYNVTYPVTLYITYLHLFSVALPVPCHMVNSRGNINVVYMYTGSAEAKSVCHGSTIGLKGTSTLFMLSLHPIQKNALRRKWQPTPVFLPGEFHDQGSLVGYSPRCCKVLGMTKHIAQHFVLFFTFTVATAFS